MEKAETKDTRKSLAELRAMLDAYILSGEIDTPCDMCDRFGVALIDNTKANFIFATKGFTSLTELSLTEIMEDARSVFNLASDSSCAANILDTYSNVSESCSLISKKTSSLLVLTAIPIENARQHEKAKLLLLKPAGVCYGSII